MDVGRLVRKQLNFPESARLISRPQLSSFFQMKPKITEYKLITPVC
jgi:hypothetical protein